MTPPTHLPNVIAALALLAWTALPASGQIVSTPGTRPADMATETELGERTGWFVGAAIETVPWLGGEAAEELVSGLGAFGLVGVEFDGGYEVSLRVGGVAYDDNLTSTDATRVYGLLFATRGWAVGRAEFKVGPGVGFDRFDREDYTRSIGALLAGVTVGAGYRLSRALSIDVALDAVWASYPTPSFVGPEPDDPDGGAEARQVGLSVGISWSLGQREGSEAGG